LNRLGSFGQNWFVYTAAYVISSFAFGILMAALIEFPVLRVRDHLFPSRGRPLTVSTEASDPSGEDLPPPLIGALEEPEAVQPESRSAMLPSGLTMRVAARDLGSDGSVR
jgi:hypothetical protein